MNLVPFALKSRAAFTPFRAKVFLGTTVAFRMVLTVKWGDPGESPEWKGQGPALTWDPDVLWTAIRPANWKHVFPSKNSDFLSSAGTESSWPASLPWLTSFTRNCCLQQRKPGFFSSQHRLFQWKGIREKKRVNYLWKRLFWEEVIESPTGSLSYSTRSLWWPACYADTQTPHHSWRQGPCGSYKTYRTGPCGWGRGPANRGLFPN